MTKIFIDSSYHCFNACQYLHQTKGGFQAQVLFKAQCYMIMVSNSKNQAIHIYLGWGSSQTIFRQKLCASDVAKKRVWVPVIDLVLDSRHGNYRYALGRRKWKCQGDYPTLTHGGLSLLEVAVPFIELSSFP